MVPTKQERAPYREMGERVRDAKETIALLAQPHPVLNHGARLRSLQEIEEQIERAKIRMYGQLGVDLAKHLAAMGIAPSGRTVQDILTEHDARSISRDTPGDAS